MYTSACIEKVIIGRTVSNKDSKDSLHSNYWNDKYYAFSYQLDQWGVDKLFHTPDAVIIRELELYAEDWEIEYQEQEPIIVYHVS